MISAGIFAGAFCPVPIDDRVSAKTFSNRWVGIAIVAGMICLPGMDTVTRRFPDGPPADSTKRLLRLPIPPIAPALQLESLPCHDFPEVGIPP